ncbi:MAG: rRNA pseudouridine synthase [Candidatus Saganbacteria bacterium]|nr:rRNA pseudouridine synthase [Candidatus Saganbacteria bacterium]
MLRLQKYIAQSGICSRRRAEEFISQGKISVNGKVITQMGTKVDPEKDLIRISGRLVKNQEKKVYIVLHKPKGFETTATKKKRTVYDLVKIPERVFPVGRLDKDSSGLLILTNDGEYANRMMHPRYEHEKEYVVDIVRPLKQDEIKKLCRGVFVLDKKSSPAKIKVISPKKISMIIHEGMNRQIRRMLEVVGNRVVDLKRVRIERIRLGSLPPGEWKIIPKPI